MGQTLTITYTCDVCGQVVTEAQVISYKLSLAMPGNGGSSQDGPQSYACQMTGHALQAAQQALATFDAQRAATPA